jgi:ubiquinone/menaquinone biosynthesis C-methylase UbiE
MDGQQLGLEDGSFEATSSLLGASIFLNWRRGLAEQARVTRRAGKACVATWRRPPSGGPLVVMASAAVRFPGLWGVKR